MRHSRLLKRVVATVVVACLVLPLAFYGASRTPWAAARLSAWLSATLGWPITVRHLAVGAWSTPWIEVEGVIVGGGPDGRGEPLLELGRLRAGFSWATLLGRATRLETLSLKAPVLHLRVDDTGAGNWGGLVARLRSIDTAGPFTWTVGALHVDRGAADCHDAGSDSDLLLTGLILDLHDFRPAVFVPFDLRLAGSVEPHTFHAVFHGEASLDVDHDVYGLRGLTYKGWVGGGTLPLAGVELAARIGSIQAELAPGRVAVDDVDFEGMGIRARIQAQAESLGQRPVLRFALDTEPFKPKQVGFALNAPLPATADPTALGQARLSLRGRWGAAGLELAPLDGQLDDSHFSGSLALPADGGPPRLRLDLDRVDLDRYRAPAAGPAATPGAVLKGLLDQLKSVDADVEVTIAETRAAGAVAHGLRVSIEADPRAAGQSTP